MKKHATVSLAILSQVVMIPFFVDFNIFAKVFFFRYFSS